MMKKHTGESIRIFDNSLLESFTHVHPIVPLVVWVPFIIFLFFKSVTVDQISLFQFGLFLVIGLLVWTLTEYLLHRIVFHWDAKSKLGKRFVFMFHGLHHDDPQDPTRLVMPPVPAILIITLLWQLFALVVPGQFMNVFMAFFLIGYLCYDYIHYATHHFPMTNPIGKYLRKYHLQHHYSGERSKYGVSNPLWDYVFNTVSGPKDHH
jgi:sterol desaturase/sphingolipid hydroxylase (fatty acid hydroxylase superfamily)